MIKQQSTLSLATDALVDVVDVRPGQRVLQVAMGDRPYEPDQAVTVSGEEAYFGDPSSGPYDRIVVTAGVAGISPHWLDQLAPDGIIYAPIAHGGMHPVLAVSKRAAGPHARPVLWADFPPAGGPLRPDALFRLDPYRPIAGPVSFRVPGGHLTLTEETYQDLWFFLAARDARITRAELDDPEFDPARGCCAKREPAHGTAWIQTDGSILAAGDRNRAMAVVNLLLAQATQWDKTLDRPSFTQWQCGFRRDDLVSHPLWLPHRWQLSTPMPQITAVEPRVRRGLGGTRPAVAPPPRPRPSPAPVR
jgi:Protein-L-isoaspartate(D-aspartate) O-methyltransferase (PCMT)